MDSQCKDLTTYVSRSLQHSILDVQLPVAACCQAIIVRHDKERLLPIACEI